MSNQSLENIKQEIQDFLIKRINESDDVDHSFIRFWKPEERIPKEEILKEHKSIYSIILMYQYIKKNNLTKITMHTCHNFRLMREGELMDSAYQIIFHITPEKITQMKDWSKQASKPVEDFLRNSGYYPRLMQFNFFAENEEKTSFIIPNLYLENIQFSTTPRNKNFTPLVELLKQKQKEKEIVQIFRARQSNAGY